MRSVTTEEVASAARDVIHPEKLVWVVVGDRRKLEPGLGALGWGPVRILDADGHVAGSP